MVPQELKHLQRVVSWMHTEARDGALDSTLYLTSFLLTEDVKTHTQENTGDLFLHKTLLTRQRVRGTDE